VRPGPGIEDDRGPFVGRGVQPAQHFVLSVGLADLDLQTQLGTGPLAQRDQVGVAGVAVDLRFAGTEAAQVRTVEDVDLHRATSR